MAVLCYVWLCYVMYGCVMLCMAVMWLCYVRIPHDCAWELAVGPKRSGWGRGAYARTRARACVCGDYSWGEDYSIKAYTAAVLDQDISIMQGPRPRSATASLGYSLHGPQNSNSECKENQVAAVYITCI